MSEHDSATSAIPPAEPPAEAKAESGAEPEAGVDRPGCGAGPLPPAGTGRLTMPPGWLTAHPGNVRAGLDLDPGFVASVQASGVLVPLRITLDTPTGDDSSAGGPAYRVIDGHRRLAAALKTGLAQVPYDLVAERQGDEAGQYLDMYNAHRHRKPLRPEEEAGALFAAHEAGATRTQIRKATGLKAPHVKAALAAATLSDGTRAAAKRAGRDLSLEDLAILAEFQDDAEAVGHLLDAAACSDSLEHSAQRLRLERDEKAAHQRLRDELESAGLTLTDSLPPGAEPLPGPHNDGEPLTAQAHAGCPGRGAWFRSWDLARPVHYCTAPRDHGHTPAWQPPAASAATAGTAGAGVPASSASGTPGEAATARTQRRAAGDRGQPGLEGRCRGPPAVAGRAAAVPAGRAPRGRRVRRPPAAGHARPGQQQPGSRAPPPPVRGNHRPRRPRMAGPVRHRDGGPGAAGDARPHRGLLRARADRRGGEEHLASRPPQPLPLRGSRTLLHLPGQPRLPPVGHRAGRRHRYPLHRRLPGAGHHHERARRRKRTRCCPARRIRAR